MEDERVAVAAGLDIELDAVPCGERGFERGAAILDPPFAVQAAMRERSWRSGRSRGPGRHPALMATMASISTAAPSGSTGTPTALRAWRPASPNTCFHQLRRAIGDLGLVGEAGGAADEHAELHDPLDAVEAAQRLADLREQHDAAGARGGLAIVDVAILAEPSGHQRAVVERELARDVEQSAGLDGRHIGGNRRGRFGKGDAERGKAV